MSKLKPTPGPWDVDLDGPFVLGGDQCIINAITAEKGVRREIATCWLATDEMDEEGPDFLEDKSNALLLVDAPDLLKVGRQMRVAQSNYFKTRTKEALKTALALEKQFDALIDKYEVEDE